MPIELIIYELTIVVILVLTVFGFFDRMFFIFSLFVNWIATVQFLTDGSLVTDKIYNPATATWINNTVTFLTSTNVPATPTLLLFILAALDVILLILRSVS